MIFLLWLFLLTLLSESLAFQVVTPTTRIIQQRFPATWLTATTATTTAEPAELQIHQRQKELAFQVASTFEPRIFRPASKLLSNRHVQTISGALLRDVQECRYIRTNTSAVNPIFKVVDPGIGILASSLLAKQSKTIKTNFWDERERIKTPDHDFFHVDYKYAACYDKKSGTDASTQPFSEKGVVILVHGLQSDTNSSLVQEMSQAHIDNGFDVAAINFRGCSGTPNNAVKSYHLGFTDDLKQLIQTTSDRLKGRGTNSSVPLFLSGKSLGANVVLKALGELGDDAVQRYNIQGAAVSGCPFDNQRNSNFLLKGFSKVVYNSNLLNSLKRMAQSQLQRFGDTPEAALVDQELLNSCTDITEFDKAFTAPLFGYRDQWDYYNQTSALHCMDRIRVPTLVFNARDDPFFDPVYYPWEFHCHSVAGEQRKSPIQIVRSDYGGHLGYMFHEDDEEAVVTSLKFNRVSFMPSELARFINHVHDSMEILDDDDDVLATNFSQPSESISNDMTSLTAKSTESPDAHAFREQAFLLSSSFEPRDFCPPRQLANEHFQTISGVFLRNDPECRYVSGGVSISSAVEKGAKLLSSLSKEADVYGDFWDHRQRISTPDGDFFHVDYKFQSDSFDMPFSKGLVVIVHGLQSNSNSSLSVDLGRAFANEGFDVACINFRGCSGVPNNSLRAYHLGFTDDLIQFLAMSNNGKLKPPPIFLSGFSLGANVVLKALGQLGSRAFDEFNVYGAAVSGAPFDNERNIQFVQQAGFNKLAYNDSLLKSLKNTALQQLNRFADSKEAKTISLEEISTLKEISAIESALIAPVFGFRDNVDYYRKTNCINFLDDIQVPTLVLNAADDPFFDPSFFPFEKGCDSAFGKEKRTPVKLVRTEHGGHLGFMFHQRRREEMNMKLGQSETSFMPQELARFVSHVFEGRNSLQKSAG